MPQKLQDVYKYYNEFRRLFGQETLEPDYVKEYYKKKQDIMAESQQRETSRALERLSAQGIMGSGVGAEYMTQYVTKPYMQAQAAIDEERIARMEAEKRSREALALEFGTKQAEMEYAEAEAARQKKSALYGKLLGAVPALAGAAIGTIVAPGVGTVAGLKIGAGVGGIFQGGLASIFGGAENVPAYTQTPQYNQYLTEALDMIKKMKEQGKTKEEIRKALEGIGLVPKL